MFCEVSPSRKRRVKSTGRNWPWRMTKLCRRSANSCRVTWVPELAVPPARLMASSSDMGAAMA